MPDIDKAKQNAEQTKEQVKDKAEQMKDHTKEMVSELPKKLNPSELREQAKEYGSKAKESV